LGPEPSNNCCGPDWRHAALLTIVVQQGFTLPGMPAENPGTASAAPHGAAGWSEAFRRRNGPIVHVVRL